MIIEFGMDYVPVVFLSSDVTEAIEEEGSLSGVDGEAQEDTASEVQQQKDPMLCSIPFCAGVSIGVIIAGVILGLLLGKRKIKKGIEIYEDI